MDTVDGNEITKEWTNYVKKLNYNQNLYDDGWMEE